MPPETVHWRAAWGALLAITSYLGRLARTDGGACQKARSRLLQALLPTGVLAEVSLLSCTAQHRPQLCNHPSLECAPEPGTSADPAFEVQ